MDVSKSNRVIKKTKRVFTIQEKQALCKEWKQSRLSMREFSKLRKVAPSALYQWFRELYPNQHQSKGNFVPVSANQTQKVIATEVETISIELSLPNQTIARIKVAKNEAIQFLQEIYHAASTIR